MSQNAIYQEFPLASELNIPAEYSAYDEATESETIVALETWKRRAYEVLTAFREHLRPRESLDARHQAEVVCLVAPFDGDDPWVLETTRNVAQDILSSRIVPDIGLLEHVLRDFVKPIFRPNPHPQLNVESGRKLPRPAGGPLGHLDYLEGQQWKAHPGVSNVLSWCISHSDSRSVEKLWHLYIPPIMTLLDDYEARYKLRGVQLVSQLLEVTPPELLKRTGIDTLLASSLKTCFTFLHHPESPDLIRVAVPTSLRLILLTTLEGSSTRFDQLCSLLGDGIIGNVWIYASREPIVLEASIGVIPSIVQELGVGTSRYLKALIPQLLFPIIPAPDNGTSLQYKLLSLRALLTVIQACALRMHKWRGAILEGVLKCWVDLADHSTNSDDAGSAELRTLLRSVTAKVMAASRPVISELDVQIDRIIALDPPIFEPLLRACVPVE